MKAEQNSSDDALLMACFNLGAAAFGIDARQVQEVAKMGDLTRVRHAPPEVVGIRNLRGRIVTIIDLAIRLKLGRVTPSPANRVLIVDCQGEPLGLLVDCVADTMNVRAEDLAPPPPSLNGLESRSLRGVCRSEGRLVAILDHDALLNAEEWHGAAPRELVSA